ncbi:TPA: phage recombination protein Bet [Escherichia coli]|uniref:phage recombination protein Bet n=5 Tax=Escherichia coli TaxID=562 RepID=UPI000D0BD0F8|nr:phage recombination protein Bet [Escherichia coli]MCB8803885.1 phage recombination protein Bet [Escherichia coli]MCK2294840.1 phage recombination protein Bet [Escherichia coli]MCK2343726.1 phage recombination protein Bet [Escherichia coli]MCS1023345.1 phage recombination protein Bet [Escherichia coli]MDZ9257193.1 phage recombination protein Bet [Escherichia coli]
MSTALATLAGKLAERVGMDSVDPQELITTLRQTAFKGDASDAQFIALLIVANQYGLNPWTKEIYAFPDKQNGIVPVVGVDGWSRIINENQQFDGMDFEQDNESCTCRIAKLESNEVREDGNQFLVVRHPGKTPVIKHCTGDLEEFLRQLIEQDPLVTIDIITHRYYGVGGQWVQDAGEYLHMMSDAGIRIKGE